MDEPYEYPDGSPVNNATRSYGGETTIRKAIQNSINVVAVKCLEQVTPALGLKYLDDFGFTTLAHGTEADKDANGNIWSDANLATALGGITNGVKMLNSVPHMQRSPMAEIILNQFTIHRSLTMTEMF